MEKVSHGIMLSFDITVWKGEGRERMERFVVILHHQSKNWPRRGDKEEKITYFDVQLECHDYPL